MKTFGLGMKRQEAPPHNAQAMSILIYNLIMTATGLCLALGIQKRDRLGVQRAQMFLREVL
jgi:hypothetical protein